MTQSLEQIFTMRQPLLLIGCGRMGRAMASGWLASGLTEAALQVVEPAGDPGLGGDVGHAGALDDLPAALTPAAIVLAVKPQVMDRVLPRLDRFRTADPLLVSIAAGIPLSRLGTVLPRAVRAMPNTPAAIGQGITAAVAAAATNDEDRQRANSLLAATGETVWLESEADMDAVTAVSGSGPAYLFAMVEAMAAAGMAEGLQPDLAMRLARQTVIGAAHLLEQSRLSAAELRQQVTSPGGTTEAGLAVLRDETGLEALMTHTVAAAAHRARELAE